MDNKLKQLLLKIVGELEDVRATVGGLTGPTNAADSRSPKEQAKNRHSEFYKELREEIEAL